MSHILFDIYVHICVEIHIYVNIYEFFICNIYERSVWGILVLFCTFVFFYHLLINKVAHWHWLRSFSSSCDCELWFMTLSSWPPNLTFKKSRCQGISVFQISRQRTVLTQFSCNVLLHFRLSCMLMMLFLFLYILKRHFVYCPLYFDRRTMS